jgi:hypothetical protein
MRNKAMFFSLFFSALLLSSGCASLLITGASGGIAYTYTNIAYKTVCFPVERVEQANHKALKRMGMKEMERKSSGDSVSIKAKTAELTIHIDIERITPQSTKMSVDVRKNMFLKDKSTASAVIEQTERILEGRLSYRAR